MSQARGTQAGAGRARWYRAVSRSMVYEDAGKTPEASVGAWRPPGSWFVAAATARDVRFVCSQTQTSSHAPCLWRSARGARPDQRATCAIGRPDSNPSRAPGSNNSCGCFLGRGIDGASPLRRTEPHNRPPFKAPVKPGMAQCSPMARSGISASIPKSTASARGATPRRGRHACESDDHLLWRIPVPGRRSRRV